MMRKFFVSFGILFLLLGQNSCREKENEMLTENRALEPIKSDENYDYIITPEKVQGDFRVYFQKILNSYKNVLIKDGVYEIELINGDGVFPQDGSTLTFAPNAKIKVKPNKLDVYVVIDLRNRKDITLINPKIEGDKDSHLSKTGEWCYGINVAECSNITINSAKITKMWGDGMVIRQAKNIKINRAILDNNRRQGISITSCENVEIHQPILSNTTGTPPAFGIDVEPNYNGEHIKNLKIYNATFTNNGQNHGVEYPAGFCLSTHSVGKKTRVGQNFVPTQFDIELINPVFHGDALMVSVPTDYTYGKLVVKNPEFHKVRETALYFFNHQSKNFQTEIISPKIYNAVQRTKNSIYYTPILFECNIGRAEKRTGTQNITISNPIIEASNSAIYKEVAIRNITTKTFSEDLKNVKIQNAKITGYKEKFLNFSGDKNTTGTPHSSFLITYQ